MIILSAYFLGELIRVFLHIPIPGNVLGMIILFISLCTGIVKVEMIEETCDFLLSHLSFFFIPAGVALMASFTAIRDNLFAILAICILSTVVVMLSTAYTIKLLKRGEKDEGID